MAKVIHFEIPAEDPEASMEFYGKVFGWKFQEWEGPQDYWLTSTGPEGEQGIDGAIMPKEKAYATVVNTIGVTSLDDVIEKIKANGGKLLTERMGVPGVGWLVYFLDPDGHQFGAMESDPNAK